MFVSAEPRGGDQEEFDSVLRGYYDSVRQGNKPDFRRKKSANKTSIKNHFAGVQCAGKNNTDGAAFLAVCRGKVHIIVVMQIDIDRSYLFSLHMLNCYISACRFQKELTSQMTMLERWYPFRSH